MMRIQTLLLCVSLLIVASLAPAQWVDLRVPFDRLMDEGHEAYAAREYQAAAAAFRGARLLRPQSPEANMNLGLAEARLRNFEAARERFEEARALIEEGDPRLADSWYNEGTTWLDQAIESLNSDDPAIKEGATDLLLEAMDRFNKATDLAPNNQRAQHNRRLTQTLLDGLEEEEPPTPESSQGEGEDEGDGEGESDESTSPSEGGEDESDENQSDSSQDQQGEQDSSPDQSGDTDSQQQPEDSSADANPPDGEPESEQEQESEGTAPAPAPPERPDEMTPEEARELLNLLGNRDLMIFRQPRTSQPPPGGRDW